jgi:hypothetical protein
MRNYATGYLHDEKPDRMIMNIPNLPNRWDLALFILGVFALFYAFQSDKVLILVSVFLMASGVTIGAQPYLLHLTTRQDATDDEVKKWLYNYYALWGVALLAVLTVLHFVLYQ